MNNTFDIKRFGLLMKRQWLELGKIYLISLGILAGVIIGFYGIFTFGNSSVQNNLELNFREPLFILLGILFLTITANTHFSQLGQKPKLIVELMIPASTLEKFLIGLFLSVFLTIVSYLLVFYLIDLAVVSKLKSIYHSEMITSSYVQGVGNVVKKVYNPVYLYQKNIPTLIKPLCALPLLISSVFFMGSVYFNKFHYVKTMISLMIFCGLWIAFIINTGQSLFNDKVRDRSYNWDPSRPEMEWGVTVLLLLLSIFLWFVTYIRLREKEV